MLFERDYRVLTEEEKVLWESVENEFAELKGEKKGLITAYDLEQYYKKLPVAALHYKQLFPNNYINYRQPADSKTMREQINQFKTLLDHRTTEIGLLNFIRDNKAYFLATSIIKYYSFGHHGTFIFKEFELPPNYVVDYLLVGKNSGGYEFVFVEFENSFGEITTKDGEFGKTIRKGIKQVKDWDSWLEPNYSSLRLVFDKYIGVKEALPREFFELDKSRLHYVVVAGRRVDYSSKTNKLKRNLMRESNIRILHYDNLIESSSDYLVSG